MSPSSSLGRLDEDGQRFDGGNSELRSYVQSSMTGLNINRNQRARSQLKSYASTQQYAPVQASKPFHSSGPRFAISPKQCKYNFLEIKFPFLFVVYTFSVNANHGNPSPNKYAVPIDHFRDITGEKGPSFGTGREKMQKTDQQRDIAYFKNNPDPHKYAPSILGKRLSQDGPNYSMSTKAHP